jgi:hypothetical protein
VCVCVCGSWVLEPDAAAEPTNMHAGEREGEWGERVQATKKQNDEDDLDDENEYDDENSNPDRSQHQ